MPRRLLTAEFVDSVTPPESGEVWIADTALRGFGLRVWASGTPDFKAFAIRKNDREGRTVRKTFKPWSDGYSRLQEKPDWRKIADENTPIGLGFFLQAARDWAVHEIAIITSSRFPYLKSDLNRDCHDSAPEFINPDLGVQALSEFVETFIWRDNSRGWREEYKVRLWKAFNRFDGESKIGAMKITELAAVKFEKFFQQSGLAPANLRALRSLLNAVFERIGDLGGPWIGRPACDWSRWTSSSTSGLEQAFVQDRIQVDVDSLLQHLRNAKGDWRPRCGIALACLFSAPVSKILSGRWSQIIDDIWYPYRPDERVHWWPKRERIDQSALEWLKLARNCADAEGVESDLWLPRQGYTDLAISSLDRQWRSLTKEITCPTIHFSVFRSFIPKKLLFAELIDFSERRKIAKELSKFKETFCTATFDQNLAKMQNSISIFR